MLNWFFQIVTIWIDETDMHNIEPFLNIQPPYSDEYEGVHARM